MADAAEPAPAAAPEGMAVDAGKLKLQVKPLKGDAFEVEYDPTVKVAELKNLICAAKAEYPAEQQKLIYAGRILVDDTAVSEYGIKTGEFVVVMLTKPKTAPVAAAAPTATPTAAPASGGDAAPAGADAPVSMETAASTMVGGSGAEAAVAQLCDMGFEREQVVRCLRAAFGNPDRAVEYLMSGIPAGMEEQAPPAAGGAAPPAAGGAPAPAAAQGGPGGGTPFPAMGGAAPFPAMGQAGGGGGGGGDAEAAAALAQLRNHPRFGELAAMVQQNPQMLAHILPTLAQSNPGLLEVIRSNPEAFMRLLAQEGTGGQAQDNADPVATMLAAAQAAQGGGAPGGVPGGEGGPAVVRLTEEEGAAVARLTELGFDRNYAAQVYLACDKNEEMAANILFDGGMDTSD